MESFREDCLFAIGASSFGSDYVKERHPVIERIDPLPLFALRQESIMSNMTYLYQLVVPSSSSQNSDRSNTTYQLRINTNIYPLNSMEISVPKDNESVPYAFMLGMDKIRTAEGCEEKLLAGYFSALCAVLPDLTKLAYKILENLGFQLKEIMVHSQSYYVTCKKIPRFHKITEVLSFAQLIYIPFAHNFNSIGKFWRTVAQNAGIRVLVYIVRESDVKTLHSALMVSGLIANLRSEAYRAQQALAATSTPFGVIFTEARNRVDIEKRDGRYGCKTYVLNS